MTVALAGAMGATAADSQSRPVDPQQEIAALKRRLVEQQDQNRMLEARIQQLQNQIKELQSRLRASPMNLQVAPTPQRVPDNWVPFQFDGQTVYLVPLNRTLPPPPRHGVTAPPGGSRAP